MKFGDQSWSDVEWRDLLGRLVDERLLSWKEITALSLGHMNPSQVGTSLASSDGFKRRYGKGQVMPRVMEWFYAQPGKCTDCGTRLELQADHNRPREDYEDPLDADFIENMVLRCRRCNVIKRPSHEFGGLTYLTTESALMWILLSFRPRTLNDYVRMCRLYGMTMADVRMQEGWAMAHWLRREEADRYAIDDEGRSCRILAWPDGGITRCWDDDEVPQKGDAKVLFDSASPTRHLVVLASTAAPGNTAVRVQVLRLKIGNLPFSHYFPEDGPECLAIAYTPPKRSGKGAQVGPSELGEPEGAAEEQVALEEMAAEADAVVTHEVIALPAGAAINLQAPRGMKILSASILAENAAARVRWIQRGRERELVLPPSSRGRRVCDVADTAAAHFAIV